jgi:hypothetical protein
LRASLQAVYGIRLSTVRTNLCALELADLVAFLPDGCALWQSIGGSRAWSPEMHLLNHIEWRLQILDWRKTKNGKDGRNQPVLTKYPALAEEREAAQTKTSLRASAWEERQKRQAQQPE